MEYRTFYLFDRVDMPLPDLVDLRPAADASVVVEGERFVPAGSDAFASVRSERGYVFGYRANNCDDVYAARPHPFLCFDIVLGSGVEYFFHVDAFDWSELNASWILRDRWFITKITSDLRHPDFLPPIPHDSALIGELIDVFMKSFVALMKLYPQVHLPMIPNVEFRSHDGLGGRHGSWPRERTSFTLGAHVFDPTHVVSSMRPVFAISDRTLGTKFWISGGIREPRRTIYRFSDEIGEIESVIYSIDDGYDQDTRSNTLGHFRPRMVDSDGSVTLNQDIGTRRLTSMIRIWAASEISWSLIRPMSFSYDVTTPATYEY